MGHFFHGTYLFHVFGTADKNDSDEYEYHKYHSFVRVGLLAGLGVPISNRTTIRMVESVAYGLSWVTMKAVGISEVMNKKLIRKYGSQYPYFWLLLEQELLN